MKKKFLVLSAISMAGVFALSSCNKELQTSGNDESILAAQSLRGNVEQVNVFGTLQQMVKVKGINGVFFFVRW